MRTRALALSLIACALLAGAPSTARAEPLIPGAVVYLAPIISPGTYEITMGEIGGQYVNFTVPPRSTFKVVVQPTAWNVDDPVALNVRLLGSDRSTVRDATKNLDLIFQTTPPDLKPVEVEWANTSDSNADYYVEIGGAPLVTYTLSVRVFVNGQEWFGFTATPTPAPAAASGG